MPRVLAHDDPDALLAVAEALETGQTIIFPTDTIYGIGGNPWDARSLERVRELKGRTADQPFAVLLPTVASIERVAALDDRTGAIVERLLPGPFTLLLPATADAPPATVREGTIGIRVPAHPFFERTLARLDRPLFGTSVNRHREPPLVDVDEIIDRFASVDLIVTGSTAASASAILDLTADPIRPVRGDLPAELRSLLEEEQNGNTAHRERGPSNRPHTDRLLEDESREREKQDRRQRHQRRRNPNLRPRQRDQ